MRHYTQKMEAYLVGPNHEPEFSSVRYHVKEAIDARNQPGAS
jgi:hypothetical protein